MKRRLLTVAKFTLPVVFTITLFQEVKAQGCSDAGFCSLGNLHTQTHDSLSANSQKFSLYLPYGIGDDGVRVFSPAIEYAKQLSNQWTVQTKLTSNYALGKLGYALGLGDTFVSATYTVKSTSSWATSLMLGAKLPLSNGNLKSNERSLPMQYQSSLGTVDVITGLNVSNAQWQFALGWQQPVSGTNNNNFLPAYWNTTDAQNYPPSRNFKRKGDALIRTGYTLTASKALSFNTGLLAIYHLGEDEFSDQNNVRTSIQGSQGLTLNVTLAGWWKLSESMTIGFTAGTPLIARDVRPDGLTRSIAFAPEISWKF